MESNYTRPNFERFSLVELVFDTAQEFRLELEAKQIKLYIHNEQNNALVFADISLIQRVFENLLRYTIAYTPEGGLIQLVIVADPNSAQKIKVMVVDTGRGISEEHMSYIFDRIYANPDRSREHVSSTGLGLAIVKRIMDINETNIQVTSKINQGMLFEFTLPKDQATLGLLHRLPGRSALSIPLKISNIKPINSPNKAGFHRIYVNAYIRLWRQ